MSDKKIELIENEAKVKRLEDSVKRKEEELK